MNAPRFDHAARWRRAAEAMARDGIDALFLMKPANLAYFTGDGRPCALALLTRSQRCIVAVPQCDVPSVERASAASEIRAFRSEEEMFHGFRDVLREQGLAEATIALEKNFFDAALFEVFSAHILPKARVVAATPLISSLRMLKDSAEIECLKDAARVADAGMAAAHAAIAAGVREVDVAGAAELAMRRAGAEGYASATYVASGWRSAMAHGPASLKPIERGDAVQVHLAPLASGYTVDLCRSFIVPPVSDEAQRALAAYVQAQQRGIAAATAGSPLMGIDAAMAESLVGAGFADAFLRPVFHGVGLEHEEAPIPGGHAVIHGEKKVERVEAGMALAIGNCGIYRQGFGVRVEDTVCVGERGQVIELTHHPKSVA